SRESQGAHSRVPGTGEYSCRGCLTRKTSLLCRQTKTKGTPQSRGREAAGGFQLSFRPLDHFPRLASGPYRLARNWQLPFCYGSISPARSWQTWDGHHKKRGFSHYRNRAKTSEDPRSRHWRKSAFHREDRECLGRD